MKMEVVEYISKCTHRKCCKFVDEAKKEKAIAIFDDLEKLDNVFVNYDIVIKGDKYKNLKKRHLGK